MPAGTFDFWQAQTAVCPQPEGRSGISLQPARKVQNDFLKALQTNIATVIKQGDTLSPEVIDERLRELQKELVKMANQKDDYDAIADEILRLRDMRTQAEVDSVVRDEQMRLIRDLQDFIRQQPTPSRTLTRRWSSA